MRKIASVFIFFICFALHADTIYLMNGDKISGSIKLITDEQVVIKTEYGNMEIDRTKITYGEFGERPVELDEETYDSSDKSMPGPVIYFPLNGTVKNDTPEKTTILDNSIKSYGNDQNSAKNEAAYSDGSGQYFSAQVSRKISDCDDFTLRVRFKTFESKRTQYLVSIWQSVQDGKALGKFAVCYSNGYFIAYLADQQGNYYTVSVEEAITPLTWTDLIFSVGPSSIVLYINGELAYESKRPFGLLQKTDIPAHFMTAVGGQNNDDFAKYNLYGFVSEIVIWDSGLTENQILSLFD